MITARMLAEKVEWLEARWGSAGKGWDRWEVFLPDFADFAPSDLQGVLDEWFMAGNKFPPRPAEVFAKLRGRAGARVAVPPPDLCSHPEPWGFDELPEGRRCRCRLCGAEWVSDLVLTPMEEEEFRSDRGQPVEVKGPVF